MQNYNEKNTAKLQEKHKKKSKLETVQYQLSKDKKEDTPLRLEENIWETIYQSVSDWIFLTDLDGRIIKTNKAGEKYTGLSCAEITGQSCCKLLHNSTKHVPDCPMQEMKCTGQKASSEILLPNGKWIHITVDPVRNNDNKIESSIHIVRYITEQKIAQQELLESEEKFRNLFTEMGHGFALHEMVFDKDGKPFDYITLEVNHAFEKILGVKKELVINKKASLILNPEEFHKWLDIFGKVMLTGTPKHYEMYSTANNKYFKGYAYSVNKKQFAVLFEDITERKKAKDSLIESEEKYRLLVETLNEAIWKIDAQWIYNFCKFENGSNARIYTVDEMMGKHLFSFMDENMS